MHWLPWIQRQLILHDVLAQTPELPEPYAPIYEKWCSVFEQFHIGKETALIGHSCGAGFLVRWLSENQRRVGKVVLVAPFLDPDGDEIESNFFDFKIDPKMIDRADSLHMLFAPEDDEEILSSVNQIKNAIPRIRTIEIPGKKHFTYRDMKTQEFPELLDVLKPF